MKRLTTDTPKDNLEAALNLFYIKDHETWVRGGGPGPEYADVSLFDFIRDVVKTHIPDVELPEDNYDLSDMMPEWLMDGIDSAEGIVALLYTAAWAYAELRHKLMRYEDAEQSKQNAQELYRLAIDTWGADAQTVMVFEEMSELQKELCKHARGKDNREAIADEIADVQIMLEQMMILHDCGQDVKEHKESKLKRLAERLTSAPPDDPEEPTETEWKGRVMRTFLGGRGT